MASLTIEETDAAGGALFSQQAEVDFNPGFNRDRPAVLNARRELPLLNGIDSLFVQTRPRLCRTRTLMAFPEGLTWT
jgi:hypothetical protein